MILTNDELKRIFFGSLSFTEGEYGIATDRFTEEQREYILSYSENFHLKTFSSTSAVIDFKTDSRSLSFEYTLSHFVSRKYAYLDIYENGTMIAHIGGEEAGTETRSVRVKLSEGEKRVRIYLPNMQRCFIKDFTLDDGSSVIPTERKKKALVLGDSITHGYDARFPSLSYANLLISEYSLDAVNQAIGGEVFRAGALGSTPIFTPDIITVAYGINDWSKKKEEDVPPAADKYFKRLRELYGDTPIVYISPIWTSRKPEKQSTLLPTVARLEEIARGYGAYVIHAFDFVPHVEEAYTDGLHPNDLGFTQYARGVIAAIDKLGILSR